MMVEGAGRVKSRLFLGPNSRNYTAHLLPEKQAFAFGGVSTKPKNPHKRGHLAYNEILT